MKLTEKTILEGFRLLKITPDNYPPFSTAEEFGKNIEECTILQEGNACYSTGMADCLVRDYNARLGTNS